MKKYKYFILSILFIGSLYLVSCEKNQTFLDDNLVDTGVGSKPVISPYNTFVDYINGGNITNNRVYPAGTKIGWELQFSSKDEISEINVYATVGSGSRGKVNTYPYKPAYSTTKKLDTLLMEYTIPTTALSGNVIKIESEVLNKNGLNAIRSFNVKAQ